MFIENDEAQNILEVAVEAGVAGVCGAELAGFSFDCDPGFIDAAIAARVVRYATTAVLEDVLECAEVRDPFVGLADEPGVAELVEQR